MHHRPTTRSTPGSESNSVLPLKSHGKDTNDTTPTRRARSSSSNNNYRFVHLVRLVHWFKALSPKQKIIVLLAVGIIILVLVLVLTVVLATGTPPAPRRPRSSPSLLTTIDTRNKYNIPNVTVVLMNHNRPRMVRESLLLTTLVQHPCISQILLCHSNPITQFTYQHPKVQNINAIAANTQHGLSLRFWYCAHASTNEWVIHVDDDMELTLRAIDTLLLEFTNNPHRIVGTYGRSYHYWANLPRHGYDTKRLYGNVEVVLTKLLIVQKEVCQAFFEYEDLVKKDLVIPFSKPLWNGEDIFLNLVANHLYSVPTNGPYNNFAIQDLELWEASDEYKDDDTGEHDVSGNMDRHRPWNVGLGNWWKAFRRSQQHAYYRGYLWYTAKRRLAAVPTNDPIRNKILGQNKGPGE